VSVTGGDTVLDVGANVGVAAVFFALQCGATQVHSFEPVAPVFEILRQNTAAIDACQIHPYGLGAHAGEAEITYYPGASAMSGLYADAQRDRGLVRGLLLKQGVAPSDADRELTERFSPQRLRCELRTLSAFLAEGALARVDLLKIDVEGAELDVLAGIQEPDWQKIGQIVIEVHDSDRHREPVSRMLESHGFQLVWERAAAMEDTPIGMVYGTRR
jgi:31-O-methyltransferase